MIPAVVIRMEARTRAQRTDELTDLLYSLQLVRYDLDTVNGRRVACQTGGRLQREAKTSKQLHSTTQQSLECIWVSPMLLLHLCVSVDRVASLQSSKTPYFLVVSANAPG